MGRSKLLRFRDNAERANVLEPGKAIYSEIKGQWREKQFKNDNPLVLELACGYGEYSTGLAGVFPEKNFIGVDIKGSRLWKGSGIAIEENLTNVAFLRTRIHALDDFFCADEVNEIWIVFPDPRPRKSDEKRRLTHSRFLDLYKRLVRGGGYIRLKTDNDELFQYTLEVLESRNDVTDLVFTDDLYHSPLREEHFGIRTRYERMFEAEGKTIKYLKFKFLD